MLVGIGTREKVMRAVWAQLEKQLERHKIVRTMAHTHIQKTFAFINQIVNIHREFSMFRFY